MMMNSLRLPRFRVMFGKPSQRFQSALLGKVGQGGPLELMGARAAKELLNGNGVLNDTFGSAWRPSPTAELFLRELLATQSTIDEFESSYIEDPNCVLKTDVTVPGENRAVNVQHLGSGVVVQMLSTGFIDSMSLMDSKIITRGESREVAREIVSRLADRFDYPNIAIVGNPGIGKSRSALISTLQLLATNRVATMVLAYKLKTAFLFVPSPNDKWVVRQCELAGTTSIEIVRVMNLRDLVVLIDPPENGDFVKDSACRKVVFCSSNEKHLRNFDKTGRILWMSPPSIEEHVAMTETLWDDKMTPLPGQHFETLAEKQAEVRRRLTIVKGQRYWCDGTAFLTRVKAIFNAANEAAARVPGNPAGLVETIYQHASAKVFNPDISGKLFDVYANPGNREENLIQPNLLALHILYGKFGNKCDVARKVLTGSHAGATVFEIAVGRILRRMNVVGNKLVVQTAERTQVSVADKDVHGQVSDLRLDEEKLVSFRNQNFPGIDFALSSTFFVNAKTKKNNQFETRVGAAVDLLKLMGVVEIADDENNTITTIKPEFKATLLFAYFPGRGRCEHKFVKGTKTWENDIHFSSWETVAKQHFDVSFQNVEDLVGGMFETERKELEKVLEFYKNQVGFNQVGFPSIGPVTSNVVVKKVKLTSYIDADWTVEIEWASRTKPELKLYLGHFGLSQTGKKEVLVVRIRNHMHRTSWIK
jgi:hypothetical protein